ncbi:hypothetical protein CQW23_00639 [Capsicum baccatum]|uniref:DUF4216 domain-containing protein n=1 Tax=Capsicum baccatum TaxID=33114 RepID=A0A2G2XLB3_CAPBA|nr:hypothetical protein CQW23_00639 [Capsicum baccatum]
MVQSFNGYVINGYKFYIEKYGSNKSMMNSGICIKDFSHSADNIDYYDRLIEILQLDYNALPFTLTMLFKCSWFDPTPKHGTKVHPQYNLVDVNKRRLFNKYEPFIMVFQASQVYFKMYPTVKKIVSEWLAVSPIKARFVVEQPRTLNDSAFQEDNSQIHEIDIDENKILNTLNDPDSMFIDMEGEKKEEDEEDNENEDEDRDKDADKDEDKDKDGDDNHDDDDEEEEEDEEDEEDEECELHKKEKKKNLIFPINMSDTPSLVGGSPDTPGFIDIPIGSSSISSTTRRLVISVIGEK